MNISGKKVHPNELNADDVITLVFPDITVSHLITGGIATNRGTFTIRDDTTIIVTRRAWIPPTGFPPQPGDIWRCQQYEYFVGATRIHTPGGSDMLPALFERTIRDSDDYRPYRLVYRKGDNTLR